MDLKKYDELRKKINTKDFEGNNKGLDKWLYLFSFLGNIGSIFFSYFLVFPGLFKAISINLIAGIWATILAFSVTIIFLVAFEVIKRYLIRSFASEYVSNKKKFKASIVGWLTISVSIIVLSFYLSIIGSKNLASTSTYKDNLVEVKATTTTDSLSIMYERKKKTYEVDNEALRTVNNQLRTTMAETPIGYVSIRKGYQLNIDKNAQIITDNQAEINKIDNQLVQHITEIKSELQQNKSQNSTEDVQNIILFIIIACFCEIIIFAGVYFREWFEYNLFVIHQQKFEKIYTKKDRYHSLLAFIYNEGKLLPGDKVMGGLELKELVAEKTTIQNSNKFVDEFLHDMDRLGVFNTVGKRRMIGCTYNEANTIVENFDEALRILENMK
jgi:hypothetical protein